VAAGYKQRPVPQDARRLERVAHIPSGTVTLAARDRSRHVAWGIKLASTNSGSATNLWKGSNAKRHA
jgi:hypothetical protein